MIPSSLILSQRSVVSDMQTDTVYLFVPWRTECTEPGCGPNVAQGGGLDPSCAVCNGSGWTEVIMPSVLKCRVRWWYGPDANYASQSGFPSGEMGDLALSFNPSYQSLLEAAHSNSKSYFEVDGYRAKIHSIVASRLGGVVTSLDVQCNLSREERSGQSDDSN